MKYQISYVPDMSFEMPKVKIDASGKRRIRSTNSHLFG